ncbi:MAG: acyl-ACP--UDP-N-acetylglucosamine O-acyltransferase [Acidiferrobacterales bacterium]
MTNRIHPTALVSTKARLGNRNSIGPYVTIEDDVQMGNGNTILQGAVLKNGTRMGNDNAVHEYAVIAGRPQDIGFKDGSTKVRIGDNNVLREYVTISRATNNEIPTSIGNENYLMNQVHLGHDCILGDNITIAPGTGLGGHVHVGNRAFISGGVMVHQFVRIGTIAMIGGNSKITKDVLPYMVTDGVPAEPYGPNSVGLRRAGFGNEDLRTLKQCYKIIKRSGLSKEEVLGQLNQFATETAIQLAQFIKNSKR